MSAQSFGSVAETGAKPGDKVKCVSVSDAESIRFTKGAIYEVIDFCGSPHVHGSSNYRGGSEAPEWIIPWRGYGARWQLVGAA